MDAKKIKTSKYISSFNIPPSEREIYDEDHDFNLVSILL
jgi:hypothetical protein